MWLFLRVASAPLLKRFSSIVEIRSNTPVHYQRFTFCFVDVAVPNLFFCISGHFFVVESAVF